MNAAIAILALVTAQRLAELVVSRRHTRALLARGAYEVGARHYPLIVAVHAAWLAALWWLAPGRAVLWPLIGLFVLLQGARLWVLATLGERWTTRIIVLPGAPLVARGPFRFVRHPNYLVVVAEIALLPLAFGLWPVALLFSLLNAAVLTVRIRAEEKALESEAGPR
ncbi:isoprenylcysteine carboxyl methyltransferase family protein [Sphingosinicella sp. LY1275]|uniref:isoprenylcysteine carboxyl methyltransferase family protein n=1 Tax=Sphingosinicella sp. LY1275 TaxID=3095379 RepID=UPI002ADEE436|nr:isoprenylcysteine carboxylmethyltransferase family protein [Sphingosinicella sp. LY1275]MEA1015211.1 isoprenylcysteine carboxylmethyltransferase family protein [Sphingosinicella sp. LY1275]